MSLCVRIKKQLSTFLLDVDFEVNNEILAVLGASGSGKSMTLKCIAGIENPDSGFISLNGRVLFDSEKRINLPPQKRRVGYLFQDYALFPHMTVAQNILSGMKSRNKSESMTKISIWLKDYHLEGYENVYPDHLSGGQKQRAALIRMLASEPECILLDEPFSALDEHLKWKLEQEVRSILTSFGKPSAFVSHNRNEVYNVCDRITCITDGKTSLPTDKKTFFEKPETVNAAILSGCKNISPVELCNDGRLYSGSWNTYFAIPSDKVSRFVKAVGIRAHYFSDQPLSGDNTSDYCFEICSSEIIEDMFEWTVMCHPKGAPEFIQWKVSKKDTSPDRLHPLKLFVKEEDLLLLS